MGIALVVMFLVGAVLTIYGLGTVTTSYPKTDRRFRTGYKYNQLPIPGDPKGWKFVIVGLALIAPPCASVVQCAYSDTPVHSGSFDMAALIADLSHRDLPVYQPQRKRPKHGKKAEPGYELLHDRNIDSPPTVPQSKDVE